MIDNKTQLKKLYEDAVCIHAVNNGYSVHGKPIRIFWKDEELQ